MTVNARRVSLCSRYSNWLGDGLTDQSEIVLQSDPVRHHFRSGCQQIDNLCFASKFNIDFDQVLIIECFYQCVTLEIQINQRSSYNLTQLVITSAQDVNKLTICVLLQSSASTLIKF